DSPATSGVAPAVDLRHVDSAFDDATGTWTLAVTFAGPPSPTDWGDLSAVLWPRGDARHACADPSTTELARFSGARTKPDSPAVYGSSTVGGAHAAALVTKDFGPGPNTITLTLADPSLAGQAPGCLQVALSHNAPLDGVGPVAFDGQAPPASTGGDVPDDDNNDITIAFPAAAARLKASRAGTVRVALKPFAAPVSGVVTLKSTGGARRTLGHRSFRAAAGAPVVVPVRLDAATRRTLARRHRLDVRIAVSATPAAGGRAATATLPARIAG
ncbi:MAG TPA: hypothetical protein VNT55_18365, partial [Baekduia sp.]|nr:hypothetical protein [Baekduia sp.]